MPTCGHVSTIYVRGVHACSCITLIVQNTFCVHSYLGIFFKLPCTFAHLGGNMGGHVVPRLALVSLEQHVFFSTWGKSDSQARITRSSTLLIKRWLGIPWEVDNGGSGVFLWYPEQQALGNQVQLNSPTHTPLSDKHLARVVPILIKGCTLVWCMFLLMTCFVPTVVSMYGHVNFSSVWTCLCVLCVHVSCLIICRCPSSFCSLIRAGASAVAGRKLCSRKCLPDTVLLARLWHQCQSDVYSSEEKENRHSHPQSFPNSVTVESCPE